MSERYQLLNLPESELWADHICLARGCTKFGIPKAYCCYFCSGSWYCSKACFDKDLAEGHHAKRCREIYGQEMVQVGRAPWHMDMQPSKSYPDRKHLGLFAKEFIPRGMPLIRAVPLFRVPLFGSQRDWTQLERDNVLPKRLKEAPCSIQEALLLSLGVKPEPEGPFSQTFLDHEDQENKEQLSFLVWKKLTQDILEDHEETIEKYARAIFGNTRRQSEMTIDFGKIPEGPRRALYFSIFSMMRVDFETALNHSCAALIEPTFYSRLNSSCKGNVFAEMFGKHMCLVAERDIEPGEELLLLWEVEYMMDRKSRMQSIRKTRRYNCQCPACHEDLLPLGNQVCIMDLIPDVLVPGALEKNQTEICIKEGGKISMVQRTQLLVAMALGDDLAVRQEGHEIYVTVDNSLPGPNKIRQILEEQDQRSRKREIRKRLLAIEESKRKDPKGFEDKKDLEVQILEATSKQRELLKASMDLSVASLTMVMNLLLFMGTGSNPINEPGLLNLYGLLLETCLFVTEPFHEARRKMPREKDLRKRAQLSMIREDKIKKVPVQCLRHEPLMIIMPEIFRLMVIKQETGSLKPSEETKRAFGSMYGKLIRWTLPKSLLSHHLARMALFTDFGYEMWMACRLFEGRNIKELKTYQ